MKFRFPIVLGLLLLVGLLSTWRPLFAQSGSIAFSQQNVASAAQAQGFTYRLYVTPFGSTTPLAAVGIPGVTCTGTGTAPITANCTAPLPLAARTGLVTGATSRLTAQDGTTTESALSAPFVPGAGVPGALTLTP